MANNESALNVVGLVDASDYLASLLARLAALEQGNGVAAVSALPELLAAQPDPRSLYFGTRRNMVPPTSSGAQRSTCQSAALWGCQKGINRACWIC